MWQPVSDAHSIERVRIIIALKQSLGVKVIRELATRFEAARTELGFQALNEITGTAMAFHVGPAGAVPIPTSEPYSLNGWEAKRIAPPETIVEALVLNSHPNQIAGQAGTALTYESVEYSRWPVFLTRFLKVSSPFLDRFTSSGDIQSVVLEYFDRFIFASDTSNGSPSDFLEGMGASLPQDAMEDGELWHLHRGWFERSSHGKLLINQNFDSQDVVVGTNEQRRSIQIMTRAEGRSGFWDAEKQSMEEQLSIMHDRTSEVFSAMISKEMRNKIGFE